MAEERISELEDVSTGTFQIEKQRGKKRERENRREYRLSKKCGTKGIT